MATVNSGAADAETAVAHAIASAALEGVEFDDEWQDRLRDVATGVISGDQLVAEEIARFKSTLQAQAS